MLHFCTYLSNIMSRHDATLIYPSYDKTPRGYPSFYVFCENKTKSTSYYKNKFQITNTTLNSGAQISQYMSNQYLYNNNVPMCHLCRLTMNNNLANFSIQNAQYICHMTLHVGQLLGNSCLLFVKATTTRIAQPHRYLIWKVAYSWNSRSLSRSSAPSCKTLPATSTRTLHN